MEIAVGDVGGVTTVSLNGRLDLSSGATLKETVKTLLSEGKVTLHLNLARVEFINSSGLGALVSIMKEARMRKGRLTLSNLADYVQEVFEITQLSHIFEIFPSQEEALASHSAVTTS